MTHPAASAHRRTRNKHLALLGGLLYCESCVARMVYSYSRKNDRQYHYYVCLNAQRKGWATCPGKSLPARAIEESVLKRVRDSQPGLFEASKWENLDRTRQVEAIQAVVERVGYDGAARQVSIRFRAVGEEVPA
jgi:site-specific DNA recombinase